MRLKASSGLNWICGLAAIALLASAASAQPRAGRTGPPGGPAEGRLMKAKAKEIGLSEETIAKIDAAIEEQKAAEAALRGESAAAMDELSELLEKNLPSEKELMAASARVGKAAAKSREHKMKSVLEMRSLLSAEELEKFMEIRRKAKGRR